MKYSSHGGRSDASSGMRKSSGVRRARNSSVVEYPFERESEARGSNATRGSTIWIDEGASGGETIEAKRGGGEGMGESGTKEVGERDLDFCGVELGSSRVVDWVAVDVSMRGARPWNAMSSSSTNSSRVGGDLVADF